ncbi:cytochrome b [Neorhizobium sp. NPDC001467]|uniref:cytochrome b n=1 Tax=Neorhizobium sp. NPDC001467 TaxID=3390595 RepID=UPI003CFF431B
MANRWRDTGLRYGIVTRLLHWSMAALICWQFSGLVIGRLFGRSGLTDLLNVTHGSLGTTILIMAAVRALWGFYNLGQRPAHERGPLGLAARVGHVVLYLLMLFVPALALLRAVGSQWGLMLYGFEIVAPGGENVEWMIAPARLLHSTLAWTLLAMIAGHILMVLIHRYLWKDTVLSRMAGRDRQVASAH